MFLFFKFKKIKKFVEQHLAAHVVFYRLCRPVIIRHRTSVSSERLIATEYKGRTGQLFGQKVPGSEVGHVSLSEYVEPLAEIKTDAQYIIETIKQCDILVRIRILLFSSVTFKMQTKNYCFSKFFCLLLFEDTIFAW